MPSIRKLSEQFVSQHAEPLMAEAGYEQDADDGLVWRKEAGEVTRLLWVMFSKHNSRSECRFTINLDVCNHRARAAVGREPRTEWRPGAGLPGNENVARALSGPAQKEQKVPPVWWATTPGAGFTNSDHSSFESALIAGIEWLGGFSSLQDCFDYFVAIERWLSYIPVGLELGVPEASDWLRVKLGEVETERHRLFLMGLAERYGVDIS